MRFPHYIFVVAVTTLIHNVCSAPVWYVYLLYSRLLFNRTNTPDNNGNISNLFYCYYSIDLQFAYTFFSGVFLQYSVFFLYFKALTRSLSIYDSLSLCFSCNNSMQHNAIVFNQRYNSFFVQFTSQFYCSHISHFGLTISLFEMMTVSKHIALCVFSPFIYVIYIILKQ